MEIGDRIHISNRNEHLQCTCAKEPKNLKQCCSPMVHLPGAVFVDACSATTFWGVDRFGDSGIVKCW